MKLYRNIIILFLIVAFLGAGYYFVYKYEPKEETTEENSSFTTVSMFKTDKENISSLEIINPDGSFTVTKGNNDAWIINNDENIKVSRSKVDTLMYEAAAITAKEIVGENVTDLYQYGLDTPERKAIIKTTDGNTVTFLAGDMTVDGSYYFVMLEGENKVYIKSASGVKSLTKSLYELRDTSLYSMTEEEINKISIKKTGNDEILLVKENSGTKEEPVYMWKIVKPLSGEIEDYVFSEQVLPKVISLSQDMSAGEKTEVECGLDNPYAVYTASSDKESYTVTIGSADGEYRYVKVSGNDGIYKVKSEKISFVELQYKQLMNKLIHLENIDDVNGVAISHGDKSFILTHTGSDENSTFMINDKQFKEDSYKKAYQAVLSVALEGYIDKPFNGAAEASIKYDRKDGKKSELTFISYDDRNYIVKVNGEGTLLIKKKQIDEIFEKLTEIYNS